MTTKKENWQTAEEALKAKLRALRGMTPPAQLERLTNGAIAQNVIHEELGLFADEPQTCHLDQATRDRLLVHARQDAAHALINTIDILERLARIRWWSRILRMAAATAFAVALGVSWIWWWHR